MLFYPYFRVANCSDGVLVLSIELALRQFELLLEVAYSGQEEFVVSLARVVICGRRKCVSLAADSWFFKSSQRPVPYGCVASHGFSLIVARERWGSGGGAKGDLRRRGPKGAVLGPDPAGVDDLLAV